MIAKEKQAANLLLNKVLGDGWVVTKKLEREEHGTGGAYSSCYEVIKGDRKGFLKAFDLTKADQVGRDATTAILNILKAFELERDILERCSKMKFKNVIELMETGDLEVEGAEKYPRVDYLILEYAEKGDVRTYIDRENATMDWKIKSLHQLAKGLSQIHSVNIVHQDIKPSNVVAKINDITKITDFGSAAPVFATNEELPESLRGDCVGTWSYAPPDLLYGYKDPVNGVSRIACDLYLLGNMVCFYFTRMNVTALIRKNLVADLCWTNTRNYGKFIEVKSFLILAFEKVLDEIRESINDARIEEQVIEIIRFLCDPDPAKRGHKKNIAGPGKNHELNRFLTMFDRLYRHYKFK